ncbi:MAG: hypothetical protein PF517_18620 [Salinivirgaceae bacterium]|jgi:hypothetical protein|nr:hypothetical protein [Salinivirgaceae bacterium]
MKKLLICTIIFLAAFSGYSQNVVAQRQPASEKAIPSLVITNFRIQYPDALVRQWFATHLTYWQNDYSSNYNNDWYNQRTVVVYTYERPNYFEVEFINNPGELSRAIYNIHGYWYETRTQLKGLPMQVLEALKKTKYNEWKISPLKEKIETDAWPEDIYRFHVSKGLKSRIIRMDPKGNIIQERFIND